MIKKFIFALLIALIALFSLISYYVFFPLPIKTFPVEFSIPQGASLRNAVAQMRAAGVLSDERPFIWLARGLNRAQDIKYGNYQLDSALSPLELLNVISSGRTKFSQITLVEGINFREMRALLDAHPDLRHDTRAMTEAELIRQLGIPAQSAEGMFFPDTYNFASGSSDMLVLKRAYQAMQRHLQEAWANRAADLPLQSPMELLILASIIEKETGRAGDRPLIASVFINRLKKGMRLQTDPTVIYGIGPNFDGNLRHNDLTRDTPFNTYTRNGLPPTPIAMPGLESLHAATHPAQSNALYFVARGDGSSQFSSTLEEHNKAVDRYQK